MSFGRLARTVWELDPRQVVGRASFRARRVLWPVVDALPRVPTRVPALARREALPSTCPLDAHDLDLLREGVLCLAGHEAALPLDSPFVPDEHDPLYRYQLHEHGWLREALTHAPELRATLSPWLDRYVETRFDPRSIALDPYPLATRLREHQGLVQLGLVAPERLAQSFADGTRLLLGLTETHLLANHLLRDRAAAVVGAAWIGGSLGPALRARTLAGFAAECDAQLDADGMHEERCPSYHAHALGDLLFALEASETFERSAERDRAREQLRAHAERALGALEAVTHADDAVAAFGDSAPRSTPRTGAMTQWAAALGLHAAAPPPQPAGELVRTTLTRSGFSTLRGDAYHAFVTHGPFGAPSQPGHAHCDLFAFELDVSGRRVVVDPGVHAYHDPVARLASRTGRAHATPVLEGEELEAVEQAEIWSRFRCGWRPRSIEARWQEDLLRCEARAFGPHHAHTVRRSFRFEPRAVHVCDAIEGAAEISTALPLAPGLDVSPTSTGAEIRDASGRLWLHVRSAAPLAIEPAEVSHRFGARAPAVRLRLRGAGRVEYTLAVPPQ
jgi:hypothetical protein